MKKFFDVLTIVLFAALILAGALLSLLSEKPEYLFFENRVPAEPPEFELSRLFDADYYAEWQNYFADNVWERESVNEIQTYIDVKLLRRPMVNDIVITQNALLPYRSPNPDLSGVEEAARNAASQIAEISGAVEAYGGRFVYVGVPSQDNVMASFYPDYLEYRAELRALTENAFSRELAARDVDFLDAAEIFKTKDPLDYYSPIDHHYNLKGAFLVYEAIITRLNGVYGAGLPVVSGDDAAFEKLPNPFVGSRNRKIFKLFDTKDGLYVYTQPGGETPFTRTNNGNAVAASVYDLPGDNESDVTYSLYMGGDVGETIIDTGRGELPTLLIAGESYTNAVETLIYRSFGKMISVDFRHNAAGIEDYIARYAPDYVVILRDDTVWLSPLRVAG